MISDKTEALGRVFDDIEKYQKQLPTFSNLKFYIERCCNEYEARYGQCKTTTELREIARSDFCHIHKRLNIFFETTNP